MTPELLAEKMRELFGENIADPDLFPRIFNFQTRFAFYELTRAAKETKEQP